jgi:superfamily II DNA or RNA helicase
MTLDPRRIALKNLRRNFTDRDYERGEGYFKQGRASLEHQTNNGSDELTLFTTNRGSGGRIYDQEIHLERVGNRVVVEGFCDCPVGYNCKHVVAGCLVWHAQAQKHSFDEWLSLFEQVSSPQDPQEQALLYHLQTTSGNPPDWEVRVIPVKRLRSGEWSKGRSLSRSSLRHLSPGPYGMDWLDVDIISLLDACDSRYWEPMARLRGTLGGVALRLMLQTGRFYLDEEPRRAPLKQGAPIAAPAMWRKQGAEGYRLTFDVSTGLEIIPLEPLHYLDRQNSCIGELQTPQGLTGQQLDLLTTAPAVSEKEAKKISRMLVMRDSPIPPPIEVAMERYSVAPTPVLGLTLDRQSALMEARLGFDYDGFVFDATAESTTKTLERDGKILRIERDQAHEAQARTRLHDLGLMPNEQEPGVHIRRFDPAQPQQILADWFEFLENRVEPLRQAGWRVDFADRTPSQLSTVEEIDAEVTQSENDWFSLRFDLELEGQKIPLLPLVSTLLEHYRPGNLPQTLYLDAGQGRYLAVSAQRIEPILQTIIDLYDRESGEDALKLSLLDSPRLLELGDARVKGGVELQKMAQRLKDFKRVKPAKLPSSFKGKLRTYQQTGLDWLQFLRQYQLGGILADDMGLGKTVQTLAHLAVEKRGRRMKRPSLIIAPTSLMGNWRREAAQFTPNLNVLVLHGPNRSDHFEQLDQYDLVFTTYPLLPRDGEVLCQQAWHYLILDEAQQIKNPKSQAAQWVRELEANHRLCLTGTPMENHLGELWAQFDFLLPGFLGAQEQFTRNYRTPIEKEGDGEKLQRLVRRTAPFMLRRVKDQVAKELPQKTELLRTAPLGDRQAVLYESIRLTMEKRVRKAIAQKGLARSHITILDALLKLRQVCCDPKLLPAGTRGVKNAESAKMEMLMELLPEMLDEGRRILLFSQFTKMLGLIETEIQKLGIGYAKLTGQTRKRDEAIQTFRQGEVNLFLISLKAGGVGLNLTEADTVIHYDPWWNPAVEHQATDRAHRIGQKKPVFVYKLVTEGTVEERILALQARKQGLADQVYGKGRKSRELPVDEETIQSLLAGI